MINELKMNKKKALGADLSDLVLKYMPHLEPAEFVQIVFLYGAKVCYDHAPTVQEANRVIEGACIVAHDWHEKEKY